MLTNHVTTLEQSRKLYELGFKRETIFYWIDYGNGGFQIVPKKDIIPCEIHYPAYLLSEIMEVLPAYITEDEWQLKFVKYEDEWTAFYSMNPERFKDSSHCSYKLMDTACDLLIWCIENGFISTK